MFVVVYISRLYVKEAMADTACDRLARRYNAAAHLVTGLIDVQLVYQHHIHNTRIRGL